MTARGIHLAVQRVLTLAVLFAACVALSRGPWPVAAGLLLLAAGVYVFYPVPSPPGDAFLYDRGPAVVGPDVLSFLFVPPLAAIPVWADPGWPQAGGALHPSAVFVWPLAAVFLAFTVIGWHHASFTLRITAAGFEVDTGRRHVFLPFSKVTGVAPWRRGLPRWMRALAPLALLIGRPGAAGALVMARDSTGIALTRRDAPEFVISSDAFERGTRAVLDACAAHGIPVSPALRKK